MRRGEEGCRQMREITKSNMALNLTAKACSQDSKSGVRASLGSSSSSTFHPPVLIGLSVPTPAGQYTVDDMKYISSSTRSA